MVRDSSVYIGREFNRNSLLYFGSSDINLDVTTHSFPTLFDNRFGFLSPIPIRRITRIFNNHDILIVHGFYLFSTLISIVLWNKRTIYIMPHGSLELYQEKFSRFRKLLFRKLFKLLANSKEVVFLVASNREMTGVKSTFPDNLVCLAGYGVDLPRENLESNFSQSANSIVLGFLGRIHPIKRIDLIIKALPEIEKSGIDVNLFIGGDGDRNLMNQLVNIAIESAVQDRVQFLGNVELTEKNNFFRSIDILVLLSENENFALVIAEAIARNIPVIVRSTIAMSDFVAEFATGVVVNSANEDEVSKAVIEIRNNYSLYVENCMRNKERLSWNTVKENWIKILTPNSIPL